MGTVWQGLVGGIGKGTNFVRADARGLTKTHDQGRDFVWAERREASGKADTEPLGRGRTWLDEASADQGGIVWQALWEASGKADADLRARGRKWLDEASAEHGSWGFIWRDLWEASGKADADLRARGRTWLDDASAEHGSGICLAGAGGRHRARRTPIFVRAGARGFDLGLADQGRGDPFGGPYVMHRQV